MAVHQAAVERLLAAAKNDTQSWAKLAYLTDRIGHRLSGSPELDAAIIWATKVMRDDGHENVRAEVVSVPKWVRGTARAEIVAPARHVLALLALGGSAATPVGGLRAEVVVVRDLAQLTRESVQGKIVLFDKALPAYGPEGTGYSETVMFRYAGPARAAEAGAVGALVRSVTARSLRSPHTGGTSFPDGIAPIPAAAVSLEDADTIARLAAQGPVTIFLELTAQLQGEVPSANVIAEIRGREKPDEIVLIGAHIDSWDVGQGAHDDGAGCVMVMQALTLIRQLDLRPRRTIRVVLFTNEENGLRGARAYAEAHGKETHVAAFEADTGSFKPEGFEIDGTPEALAQLRDVLSLLVPVGAHNASVGYGGADIRPLKDFGVPLLGLVMDASTYFDYHHSEADTLDKVDPAHLRTNTGVMAALAYVLAEMPEPLHRPTTP